MNALTKMLRDGWTAFVVGLRWQRHLDTLLAVCSMGTKSRHQRHYHVKVILSITE